MKAILAAILPILVSATALASQSGSYTGRWLVTVKLPPQFANTTCLSLTDDGSDGARHSGAVTSSGDMAKGLSGTFQVAKGLLVVNLESGSQTGEVVWLSFIAHAKNGAVGNGVFNEPGYFPATSLVFGQKGSC